MRLRDRRSGELFLPIIIMAAAENIKAGFLREKDVFAENGIAYCNPLVSLGEPQLVAKQLYESMQKALALDWDEVQPAVDAGFRALRRFNDSMRRPAVHLDAILDERRSEPQRYGAAIERRDRRFRLANLGTETPQYTAHECLEGKFLARPPTADLSAEPVLRWARDRQDRQPIDFQLR